MVQSKMKNIIIYLTTSLLILSCQEKIQEMAAEKQFLTLTKDQVAAMDIGLAPIKNKAVMPIVFATGKIDLLPNSKAFLTSNIKGKVERILVKEGDRVKAGQPIIEITSMELIQLQQDYLAAMNEVEFLETEYERQKELRKSNVGALAEFQRKESEYFKAKNTVEAIKEKLKLLGIDMSRLVKHKTADIVNKLYIQSPINGSVFKITASIGSTVETTMPLAEIIDLSKIHANIDVYENDVDQVHVGQIVDIDFINLATPNILGKVEKILESIDPETRAIPVHVSLKIPQGSTVLPEMLLKVKITGKPTSGTKPVVSKAGLLQEGELYYVYYALPLEDGNYEFHKIKANLGESTETESEFTPGLPLPKNALLIQKNVYLVDAEARKQGY